MMTFKKENGIYIGAVRGGRQVSFNDKREMVDCAKLRAEYLNMFGLKREAVGTLMSMASCVRRNARFSLVAMKKKPVMEKKNVRITIDPDVEYIGNSKLGIRNSKFVLEKEKALA